MRGFNSNSGVRIAARGESVVRREYRYQHDSRPAALASLELILARGHSVKMANVGGKFVVTEQVLS